MGGNKSLFNVLREITQGLSNSRRRQRKKIKEESMPAKRLRASREGYLTSKLARAPPKRLTGPDYTKLGADGKQLLRVWRNAWALPLLLSTATCPAGAHQRPPENEGHVW
eukprot:1161238-Pelagomonas_calceolata.AAC.2